MKKVAISYGWTEGPLQAKKLRAKLRESGFQVIKDQKPADIIIAHSGGCFLLPEQGKAEIVMMVGLPYWPNRHLLNSLYQKIRTETKNLGWIKKTLFNTYYLFARPRQWFRMYKAWKKVSLPRSSDYSSIICVRNRHDHFLHPIESEVLSKKHGWQHVLLDGTHDDLWLNPDKYVEILHSALRKR